MQTFSRVFFIRISLLLLCMCRLITAYAQNNTDTLLSKLDPQRYAEAITKKASNLEEKLVSSSTKLLNRLQKQEEKVFRKLLQGKDSLTGKAQLSAVRERYAQLKSGLKSNKVLQKATQYIPHLDSLSTSLQFLQAGGVNANLQSALDKTKLLQDKFQQAELIKKFIRERKEALKQQLEKLGMLKQFKKINKEVYYFAQQIKEYKEILKDPKKIERKALELLSKTKLFKDFMRKNSMLASLFGLPDNYGTPESIAGLQTRAQVSALIQQQVTAGGAAGREQFQQNIQSAQSQLQELQSRLFKQGGGESGDDLPDFKPNTQKTKGFLKRLEYGTNFQSQKSTYYFPSTTDVGLSVGYKLNDKSIVGIGASYKAGLGRGWDRIKLTHEGIGVRSFLDIKLKGSFWMSGGFEANYRSSFRDFSVLQNNSAWQQSGLIGISKQVSLKTKFFKKTNIKLLWDFLSYQQVPRTQAVIFRVGYNF